MSGIPLDPAPHPVLAALTAARAALSAAAAAPGWSMSDAEVTAALEQALAARAQLEAVTAAAVEQADARVLGAELNQPDTARWLRRRFRVSAREAARLSGFPRALRSYPATGAALGAGGVGTEQAAAIGRALGELPPTTSLADRDRAEALLLEQAATLDPDELARCGRALREALTVLPDVDDPAEAAEVAAAEERAARQAAARRLRLTSRRDGMVGIDGLLDPLAGAVVRAALEARAGRHRDDDGVTDDRTKPERLADALHELAATAGPTDTTDRPHPLVPGAGLDDRPVDPTDEPANPADPADEPADQAPEDTEQADTGQADTEQADTERADGGTGQADTGRADTGRADAEQADAEQADADAEQADADAEQADAERADTDARADTQQADAGQAVERADAEQAVGWADAEQAVGRAGDPRAGHPRPGEPGRGAVEAPAGRAGPAGAGVRRGGTQVHLLIHWERLLALRPRAGMLEDGTELSPSQLLTALCDANVLPMVFAGAAQPLHLGRRRRLFTAGQHAVLSARDRGCAFPGCSRPPSACTSHHMRDWSAQHGPTDVDNGCLICPHDHALVHREGWQARLAGNGYPEFVPPPAYDPHRRPRQHLRYRGAPDAKPSRPADMAS